MMSPLGKFCATQAVDRITAEQLYDLYAGAPDLVTACEAALPWMRDKAGEDARAATALDQLRAAIAKARTGPEALGDARAWIARNPGPFADLVRTKAAMLSGEAMPADLLRAEA